MFVTKSTNPALIASTMMISHTRSISTRSFALSCRLLSIIDFTMVSAKSLWTSAFVNIDAFALVHTRDYTFGCNWWRISEFVDLLMIIIVGFKWADYSQISQ